MTSCIASSARRVDEDECVRFKTYSKTTADGNVERTDYDGEIDAFAVRCKDSETLYWVPEAAAGTKNTYLRVTEPEIDHPNVKLADDYLLEDALH